MKCKTKREMQEPVAGYNAKSSPVTTGVCPVCGTKLYRMGKTEGHAGMTPPPKPEKVAKIVKAVKVEKRSGKLVIVESPAKARTVGRFLGRGYTVRASVGHVRDLLKSQLSVDVDNNFVPKYRVPNEKKEVVKELKKLAQTAKGLKGYIIEVMGYADSTGSAAMNTKLSEDRARAVVTFLMQQGGVPVRHIVAPGAMGEYGPVAPNETKAGRAENRRVDVKVLLNKGIGGA